MIDIRLGDLNWKYIVKLNCNDEIKYIFHYTNLNLKVELEGNFKEIDELFLIYY